MERKRESFEFDPWKCGAPGLTLSNENRTAVAPGDGAKGEARTVLANCALTKGRYYWEIVVDHCPVGTRSCGTLYVGLATEKVDLSIPLCRKQCIGWYDESFSDSSRLCVVRPSIPGGTSTGQGHRIGIYFDSKTGTFRFFVDKVRVASGSLDMERGPYFPAVSLYADKMYPKCTVTIDSQAELPPGVDV